eukprot:CAMPEP_0185019266 /NCGR_PEP_ID=MMETSP1103-20130426/1883_1 /TAXON_ID=36769 /ORGANISM="Paraphysomonas bandaiensis, Strain Caron Lab Isolate" /LENGTH=336 /DNA_ID=CAMNT_0027549473 /DNA_START=74 /DNA_END=1084 /DNA_ORIENTATION=-
MTFAWNQSSSPITAGVGTEMIKLAKAAGVSHIDSARIYAGGSTEPMVGECLKACGALQDDTMKVTTKAHPSQPMGLSATGLEAQLKDSLTAMGLDRVDEFYLHQPDTENDLAETLAAAHELVQRGLVGRLGMSNYHESEVERAVQLCAENGWTAPSVYQGLYNPLNRRCEAGLLPLLKRHNIDFIAYNSLAAGLLTGKHRAGSDVQAGRFKNNPNYLPRFYTDRNFEAVELIRASLPEGMDLITATYQWLLRHSSLESNDGILLGASSITQLQGNLRACKAAESADDLPEATLQAFDEAWRLCEEGAFPYWRSYSKDHPNRENLDQGASYQANKVK